MKYIGDRVPIHCVIEIPDALNKILTWDMVGQMNVFTLVHNKRTGKQRSMRVHHLELILKTKEPQNMN